MFGYKKAMEESQQPKLMNIKLDQISINKWQPKKIFDAKTQYDLVLSMRYDGLKQPITVKELLNNTFEIVSGERRFLSAKALNWDTIEAYVIPKEEEPNQVLTKEPGLFVLDSIESKPNIQTCILDKRIYINSLKDIVKRMNTGGLLAKFTIKEKNNQVQVIIDISENI